MLRTLLVGVVVLGLSACGSSSGSDLFSGGSGGVGGSGGSGAAGGSAGSSSGGSAGSAGGAGLGGGAGASGRGGTGGSAGADGGVTGCDLNGFWASYSTINVTWPGTNVIKAGNGVIQIWLLHERTEKGTDVNDVVHQCGIQIPGFETNFFAFNEKYGVRFLADTFNSFPTSPAHATIAPSGDFHSDPFAIMFGLTLANPLVDAWPTLQTIKTADTDQDGHPGVTVQCEDGSGYAHPPVALAAINPPRAKDLFIASRTVAKLSGTLTSCDAMSGPVEVVPVGGGSGIGSHIVGCILENGTECNSQQTGFADTNSPAFQPASGSKMVSKRVDAQTSCANVRAMFP